MSLSFKPQNTKASATKRIIRYVEIMENSFLIFYLFFRDLRDLEKCPVPGLGVCCPDESNPFVLHCNVCFLLLFIESIFI